MVKRILLKCDEEFFFKLKEDKAKRESNLNINLKWEDYIKLLFGLKK